LQHSIGEAIRKEQSILKHQKSEEVFHTDLNSRIKELEGRLSRYLAMHEERSRKVKLLESALATEHETKQDQLVLIKKSLSRAEKILKSAAKDKKHSRGEIMATKSVLDRIRKKVKQIERNL
jgi:hypothetical protein